VAVAGDEKATSAEDDFAVSRSKRFETPMYLIADSYSNTSKQVYDDILSNRPDINEIEIRYVKRSGVVLVFK
jgi:hypothetical protein